MEEKIISIINSIRENKDLDKILVLNNDMLLREDLGFDSLDLAELTAKIEREFKVDIFKNGIVHKIRDIKLILNIH